MKNNETNSTIKYYNDNANEYFEKTINVDMSTMYAFFESYIARGMYILDFGCGSGRDSKYFIDKGYIVDAIDGSKELCKKASKYIGKEVKNVNFFDFDENGKYDAIWASASLLHIANDNTILIMEKLYNALKKNGYIYVSWKYGEEEYIENGKFYNNMTEDKLNLLLEYFNNKHNMQKLLLKNIIVTEDNLSTRRAIKWLNALLKKSE